MCHVNRVESRHRGHMHCAQSVELAPTRLTRRNACLHDRGILSRWVPTYNARSGWASDTNKLLGVETQTTGEIHGFVIES
jgi:hypothetical protein